MTERIEGTSEAPDRNRPEDLAVCPLPPAVLESEEFRGTLDRALEMVVPVVADYAFIHLAYGDAQIVEAVFRHRDPGKYGLLETLLTDLRGDMTAPGSVIHTAVHTGRAQRVAGSGSLPTGIQARSDAVTDVVGELGPRSFMVVPLVAGSGIVGCISFARFEDSRLYDENDLQFGAAVAGQTGLAIDKVVQYKEMDRARQRAEAAAEEVRFHARVLESVGEAVAAVDLGGSIVYWNPAAERLYGFSKEEAIGSDLSVTAPADAERARLTEAMKTLSAGHSWTGEVVMKRRDGTSFPAQLTGTPFYSEDGKPLGIITVASDLTRRKELEGQVIQAQRLQAVGGLAGGVAHDLNNALTGIQGFTELILQDLPPTAGARGDLEEIKEAAGRAAGLVQQLLAFSRRQLLQPARIDLNQVIEGVSRVLRRTVREDVEIDFDLDERLGDIHADPRQLEQVILNLVQNAVEAMPTGGRLSVRTSNERIDAERADLFQYDVKEGSYVELLVSDTGRGMTAEIRDRAFEPFFTTKAPGEGPGLGLSTVYGIVKQSGGYVWIESQPDRGTTVRVYLPRWDQPPAQHGTDGEGPSARILLVEDDEAVRTVIRRILLKEGFEVLDAPNGREALSAAAAGRFDAVITDVVMPEMNGREMVDALVEAVPGLPVLFISGHADDQVARLGISERGYAYLAKPFTTEALVTKVRALLRSEEPGAGGPVETTDPPSEG